MRPLKLPLFFFVVATLQAGEIVGSFHTVYLPEQSNSTTQRLDYLESKLGIEHYWFQYSLPSDKKLIAVFETEMEGKPFPSGTGTYHIAPPKNSKTLEQHIHISLWFPPYPAQGNDRTLIEVSFADRSSFSFPVPKAILQSPESLARMETPGRQAREMKQNPPDALELSKDYVVWSYVVCEEGGKELLRCTLTVRAEPVEPADKPGLVRRIQ